MPRHAKKLDPRTWYEGKKEMASTIGNLAISAVTVVFLCLEPAQFLGVAPGINGFTHAVSFLGGYLSVQVYRWNCAHT